MIPKRKIRPVSNQLIPQPKINKNPKIKYLYFKCCRFEEIILENSDFVTYKGVANYNQTVSVLKDYFLLLFPTYFHGEGFAGCLIDAFFAGIPVVATDWLYNKDVIIDNKNGILVPIKSPRDIANAILRLYKDRNFAFQISLNNIEEANNYTPEKVLNGLYKYLDS